MRLRSALRILVASCAGLVAVPAVQADTFYGWDFSGHTIYSIDSTTGASTALSNTGVQLPGLAYNPANGLLYARSWEGTSGVYTVNPLTGATTLVTASAAFNGTGLTFSGDYSKLYSVNNANQLMAYDVATASVTVIGNTGKNLYDDTIDLAVNANGDLYGTGLSGNLYRLDTGTGAATALGNVGVAGNAGYTAITFGLDGRLYGIGTGNDRLYAIDTQTLAVTAVGGDVGFDVRGMTNASVQGAVPLPGVAAAGVALLAALGGMRPRRAQPNA